ncbi:MAG: Rieske (2Fe-2S) protein [Chitinophagales bacterium]|nr:Rieske (2Fe-2S) protein [Chitinophagales bacterium]MCZ2392477.1 Rieske (2Fe-2S) protein [Chitinophagales bacterium]
MESLDTNYQWHQLPEEIVQQLNSLKEQELIHIEWQDKKLCISLINGQFHGINDRCPHAGTPLSFAKTCNKKGVIVCPTHHYKFDIKSGRSTDGNNYKIPNYLFHRVDEALYIGTKK